MMPGSAPECGSWAETARLSVEGNRLEPATWAADAVAAVPDEDVLFGVLSAVAKSDGLLGDFLWQALQYQGMREVLFRRSFPELEG